jgi:hypothetical protein
VKQGARSTLRDRFRAGLHRAAGARLLAALLLVVAFSAGACFSEFVPYDCAVWNYSDQVYVVVINDSRGPDAILVTPANSAVSDSADSEPQEAVLYDATCSKRLETLKLHPGVGDVVISADGSMSAAASPLGDPGPSDPPHGQILPIPPNCRQYTRAVSR